MIRNDNIARFAVLRRTVGQQATRQQVATQKCGFTLLRSNVGQSNETSTFRFRPVFSEAIVVGRLVRESVCVSRAKRQHFVFDQFGVFVEAIVVGRLVGKRCVLKGILRSDSRGYDL